MCINRVIIESSEDILVSEQGKRCALEVPVLVSYEYGLWGELGCRNNCIVFCTWDTYGKSRQGFCALKKWDVNYKSQIHQAVLCNVFKIENFDFYLVPIVPSLNDRPVNLYFCFCFFLKSLHSTCHSFNF